MTEGPQRIGRVSTVMVLSPRPAAAAVSSVVARVRRRSLRRRLAFPGPVRFDGPTATHLRRTVLAVVDQISAKLGVKPKCYDLSVVNFSASSAADLGAEVSGFSADAAALMAMLSAALKLPIRQDVVMTGHVASTEGDLRPVSNLLVKLEAAAAHDGTQTFLYPATDADGSRAALCPEDQRREEGAIEAARGELRLHLVLDIAEVLRRVAGGEAIARSALRSGYFETDAACVAGDSTIDRAARWLGLGNPPRFWRAMEAHLRAGRGEDAKTLLGARVSYQLRRKRYPSGLGRRLLLLVRSLPPATRRLNKAAFPLAGVDRCLKLGNLAGEADLPDTQQLLDAINGRAYAFSRRRKGKVPGKKRSEDAEAAVDAALHEIRAEALAERIGVPIDAARAGFVLSEVTLESHAVFHETVTAFYVAMLSHTDLAPVPENEDAMAASATSFLDSAFRDQGGVEGAWAEARSGVNGGMRRVLDVMTEHYKARCQAEHVQCILDEILDPLDWDARVAFTRAFLGRLSSQLPPEVLSQPPERFASHASEIVQTYVQSIDRVGYLLRKL